MRTVFQKFVLCFLAGILLFSLVSCEQRSNGFLNLGGRSEESDTISTIAKAEDVLQETIPNETVLETTIRKEENPGEIEQEPTIPDVDTPSVEQTTPEEMVSPDVTSEQTPPEITEPDETTTFEEITTPKEVIKPQETTTSGETIPPQENTTPEEVTTPEPPHVHTIINGQCVCGYVLVLENVSSFDNDKDGNKDIFYFSAVLPECFTSKNAIHFGADEYDDYLSSDIGFLHDEGDIYYFCRKGRKSYIVYVVEVAQTGVYDMAICQRIKDTEVYGAKFTVENESGEVYSFAMSYQFANEQDMASVCEDSQTMASYMFGIELELAAGVNYIKIELAPGIEEGQCFRDFYLVKTSK